MSRGLNKAVVSILRAFDADKIPLIGVKGLPQALYAQSSSFNVSKQIENWSYSVSGKYYTKDFI
jgi:hypothetical protein